MHNCTYHRHQLPDSVFQVGQSLPIAILSGKSVCRRERVRGEARERRGEGEERERRVERCESREAKERVRVSEGKVRVRQVEGIQ